MSGFCWVPAPSCPSVRAGPEPCCPGRRRSRLPTRWQCRSPAGAAPSCCPYPGTQPSLCPRAVRGCPRCVGPWPCQGSWQSLFSPWRSGGSPEPPVSCDTCAVTAHWKASGGAPGDHCAPWQRLALAALRQGNVPVVRAGSSQQRCPCRSRGSHGEMFPCSPACVQTDPESQGDGETLRGCCSSGPGALGG